MTGPRDDAVAVHKLLGFPCSPYQSTECLKGEKNDRHCSRGFDDRRWCIAIRLDETVGL